MKEVFHSLKKNSSKTKVRILMTVNKIILENKQYRIVQFHQINNQILFILDQFSRKQEGYCIFIDLNSNKKLYETNYQNDNDFDFFPGQFTFDSQYFVQQFIFKIKNKLLNNYQQIKLLILIQQIISLFKNKITYNDLNIKIKIDNRINIYSIEEEKIIDEYGYEDLEDYYLIDQIQDEIYLTQTEQNRLSFNFNQRSIQTIHIKNLIDEKYYDYKILSNGILSITMNNQEKFETILCDLRSKKILRNYKSQKTNNKNNKSLFCNSQYKNEQINAFSINNNKYFRFNIMKGVLKQLKFTINQKFDQIILSDNILVGITNDYSELKYFCFV